MISIEDIQVQLAAVLDRLAARSRDLVKYGRTVAEAAHTDVSRDAAYQRNFNGLYMVRRNEAWRQAYYAIFEASKRQGTPDFRGVLMQIHAATGRIEASFASKLVATIDPQRAVYDSIVRLNFGLPMRTGPAAQRIDRLCEDYAAIDGTLTALCRHAQFAPLRRAFDDRLTDFSQFSDVKVVDLMIWQMRLPSLGTH